MPIVGINHSIAVKEEAPFFKSLAELDEWSAKPHPKLDGVLPYTPRSAGAASEQHHGKLLVKHERLLIG
jgi:mannosyl-glycoprotein endo-beta-N-acetylglucosaminidase